MNWNEWFYYKDGQLCWLVNNNSRAQKGSVAGFYESKGYRKVRLKGKNYFVHRVVWELHKGTIPEGYQIDHVNGIKDDNRIENLRLATNSENQCNCRAPKNNTSGYKGVTWNKRKNEWHAQIRHNKKYIHLGYFNTSEEAATAYEATAKQLQGEFYCITS